jgi:hypothetical protein
MSVDKFEEEDFKVGMLIQYLAMNEDVRGMICCVVKVEYRKVYVRRQYTFRDVTHFIGYFSVPVLKTKLKILG